MLSDALLCRKVGGDRRPVAEPAVWSPFVVEPAPAFAQHVSFEQAMEQFGIQRLTPFTDRGAGFRRSPVLILRRLWVLAINPAWRHTR